MKPSEMIPGCWYQYRPTQGEPLREMPGSEWSKPMRAVKVYDFGVGMHNDRAFIDGGYQVWRECCEHGRYTFDACAVCHRGRGYDGTREEESYWEKIARETGSKLNASLDEVDRLMGLVASLSAECNDRSEHQLALVTRVKQLEALLLKVDERRRVHQQPTCLSLTLEQAKELYGIDLGVDWAHTAKPATFIVDSEPAAKPIDKTKEQGSGIAKLNLPAPRAEIVVRCQGDWED